MYTATGCDYTSFFSGVGKSSFLKAFYQYSRFISSGRVRNATGTLADVNLETNFTNGSLAFLRLVGTAYFKKHSRNFPQDTPKDTSTIFGKMACHHHRLWIEDIKQQIWDRVLYESDDTQYRCTVPTLATHMLGDL